MPNETSMDIRSMTTESGQQAVTLDATKCTADNLSLFLKHIKSCRFLLGWLENDGKTLLEQKGPLAHDEWKALAEQCYLALEVMPNTKSLRLIYQLAIRKGIDSILTLTKTKQIDGGNAMAYFLTVTNELTPPRFGIGSHNCTVEESREMIDSLIPIAKAWKSIDMLRRISDRRFPGRDEMAREIFVEYYRDWKYLGK